MQNIFLLCSQSCIFHNNNKNSIKPIKGGPSILTDITKTLILKKKIDATKAKYAKNIRRKWLVLKVLQNSLAGKYLGESMVAGKVPFQILQHFMAGKWPWRDHGSWTGAILN